MEIAMSTLRRVVVVGLLSLAAVVTSAFGQGACPPACQSSTPSGPIWWVSERHCAIGPNGNSRLQRQRSLSDDGQYAVFYSDSDQLICGCADSNMRRDVVLFDRITGCTELVSVNSSGVQGHGASDFPTISGDGQYIFFDSSSDNFGQQTGPLIWMRDRVNNTTTCVSLDSAGRAVSGVVPVCSRDGNFVAFQTADAIDGVGNGIFQECRRNLLTGTTQIVSVSSSGVLGNGQCGTAAISYDGTYVVFSTQATNLDTAHDLNGVGDVYLRDFNTGTTILVSRTPQGIAGNGRSYVGSVSGDGRFIFFTSAATDLTPQIDANGTSWDVYRYEVGTPTGNIQRVSVDAAALQGDGNSTDPMCSSDGRFISFISESTNLVLPDGNATLTDIVVRDLVTGHTRIVSSGSGCTAANGRADEGYASISGDGRYLLFPSFATNIAGSPSGSYSEVYLRDLGTCLPPSISMHPTRIVNGTPTTYRPAVNACPPHQSFTFRSAAIGDAPLAFRWCKDGVPLDDVTTGPGNLFSGTHGPELTITASDDPRISPPIGSYKAQVTNACSCGLAETRPVMLTFYYPADLDDGSMTGMPDGGVTIDDFLYFLFIFEGGGCGP